MYIYMIITITTIDSALRGMSDLERQADSAAANCNGGKSTG